MKTKKLATIAAITIAAAMALTGCGPKSPDDLREKLIAEGGDCEEPEPDEGEGWAGVDFRCIWPGTTLSPVYITVVEDENAVELYVNDQMSMITEAFVVGDNWIAEQSPAADAPDDATKIIKESIGGEIQSPPPGNERSIPSYAPVEPANPASNGG